MPLASLAAPVAFVDGNLLYAPRRRDCWALYRLEMCSYTGLPVRGKLEVASSLEGLAYRIGADFRLLRVQRAFDPAAYVAAAETTFDRGRGHRELWERYLGLHRRALSGQAVFVPECYLSVRLHDAAGDAADRALAAVAGGPAALVERARSALERPAVLQSSGERERLLVRERLVFERVTSYLGAERATGAEIQWLLRRPYVRGLAEPGLDAYWASQAIEIDGPGDVVSRWLPRGAEVIRLHDGYVERGLAHLVVRGSSGTSHQALLVLGGLPDPAWLPGDAEVMSGPVDGLGFAVDVSLYARFMPNRQARATAEKRKVDAANQLREEAEGADHGPAERTLDRPAAARELEAELNAPARPPLLPGAVTLAVGAPDAATLAERVEALRDAYGAVSLHRPAGEQHRLFLGAFPAGVFPVADYLTPFTVEQVGAMVPHATTRVGSDRGPYLGRTVGSGGQPVLFDLAEAAQHSRPPTVYLVGTLGTGKTVTLMLLLFAAALQGSRIVDIDPKGSGDLPDHKLDALPGMAALIERIELRGDGAHRGLLDPLRVAPPDSRFDMAVGFLADLLPAEEPGWLVAIEEAVKRVVDRGSGVGAPVGASEPTCGDVLRLLADGEDEGARAAARALAVHADSGLAQLGFAAPGAAPPPVGTKQIVHIQIRGLPHIGANVRRSDITRDERIGQAVLRLVALYGMRVASAKEPGQHSVLAVDEAWRLLASGGGGAGGMGLRLLEEMVRWARSLNATPVLASQRVGDAEALDGLIGTTMVFGLESQAEADQALRLLGVGDGSPELRAAVLRGGAGRCVMRDVHGRVGRVQVDPLDERVLRALATTPEARGAQGEEARSDQA